MFAHEEKAELHTRLQGRAPTFRGATPRSVLVGKSSALTVCVLSTAAVRVGGLPQRGQRASSGPGEAVLAACACCAPSARVPAGCGWEDMAGKQATP